MPRGTTPFVRKTWELLCDEALESIVSWSRNGETFAILDSDTFSSQVLPQYFKHNNLCSFVRQLNTYGFKKVTTRDSKDLEFKHKLFHRDHEELLPHIVRRTGHGKLFDDGYRQEELLHQLVETNKELIRRMTEMEEQREVLEGALLSMRQELGETRHMVFQLDSALAWKNQHGQQQTGFPGGGPSHPSRPRGRVIPHPPEGRRAPPTPVHMIAPSPTPPGGGPPPTPPISCEFGKWNSAFGASNGTSLPPPPSLASSPPENTGEWDLPLHAALDLGEEFFSSL